MPSLTPDTMKELDLNQLLSVLKFVEANSG